MASRDISNIRLIGHTGVLVKQRPLEDKVDKSGLIDPFYTVEENEHTGKLDSKLSRSKWSTIADVLKISKAAEKFIEENELEVKVGDTIYMRGGANHHNNWFTFDRQYESQAHEGYLILHPNMIQCILDDENTNNNGN